MSEPIGVGIVGLGFMGKTHARAYRLADRAGASNRIVAVYSADTATCSPRGNLASGSEDPDAHLDPAHVRFHDSLDSLAADPGVGLVSVCTPTDTHVEIASRLLRSGKHVLLEKPVAIRSADVARLRDIAAAAQRHCIPAMCMRFWPGWDWLIAQMDSLALGSIVSASFTRIGSRPTWSRDFYLDRNRSGGALFDLHIHDVDILTRLFGPPYEVVSTGDIFGVSTIYRFDNYNTPVRAAAEGAWVEPEGFPFRMRFCVQFDRAVADWDLSRPVESRLLLTRDGSTNPVRIGDGAGYEYQAAAVVRALATGAKKPPVSLDDALLATRILEAEQQSLTLMRPINITAPSGL